MSNNRKKQVDEFVKVDNNDDLIKIEEFDGIPLSRYFYNTKTDEVLLYMPICGQYKLLKPTKSFSQKGSQSDIIFLIPSDNGKRVGKRFKKFIEHIHKVYSK